MADYSALEAIEKRILASGRKPTRADQRTLAPLMIERRKKKGAEEDAIVKARQPKTRAEAGDLSRRGLLKSREQILSEYAAEKQKEKQKSSNVPVTANVPAGRTRSEESTQLPPMERKKEAFTEQEIAEKRSAKEEAEFKDKFGIGYEDIPVTADVPSDDIRSMNEPTGNALSVEPVADEKTPSAPMGNVSTEIGEPAQVELDETRMAQLYRKTTGAEYNPEVSKAAREKMAQLKSFVSNNPDMLNKSDTRIALDFYKTLK